MSITHQKDAQQQPGGNPNSFQAQLKQVAREMNPGGSASTPPASSLAPDSFQAQLKNLTQGMKQQAGNATAPGPTGDPSTITGQALVDEMMFPELEEQLAKLPRDTPQPQPTAAPVNEPNISRELIGALLGGAAGAGIGGLATAHTPAQEGEDRGQRRNRILRNLLLSGMGGAAVGGLAGHISKQANQQPGGDWISKLQTGAKDLYDKAQPTIQSGLDSARKLVPEGLNIPKEYHAPLAAGAISAGVGGLATMLTPQNAEERMYGGKWKRVLRNTLLAGGAGAGAAALGQQGMKLIDTSVPDNDPGPVADYTSATGQFMDQAAKDLEQMKGDPTGALVGTAAAGTGAAALNQRVRNTPRALKDLHATGMGFNADSPAQTMMRASNNAFTMPGRGTSPESALRSFWEETKLSPQALNDTRTSLSGYDTSRIQQYVRSLQAAGVKVNPQILQALDMGTGVPGLRGVGAALRRWMPRKGMLGATVGLPAAAYGLHKLDQANKLTLPYAMSHPNQSEMHAAQ